METQTQSNETTTQQALFVKMAVDAWQTQNTRMDELLQKLSDEDLQQETATGRNSGTYLLGHLTAVNDSLLKLLGFEEKLYPHLSKIFLDHPDKSILEKPSVQELRKYWTDVNVKLNEHISKLPSQDWFMKHTSVSEEDFQKEPHRNRLNVLMNRTTHLGYHLGQLNYLLKKG